MTTWKVVVAGCGQMANTWIEYAREREDTEIVGLVDIWPEAALQMADRHGLSCGLYSDLREAIRRSGANLVFDVTTPDAHRATSGTALEMGCHVIAEKPMASSLTAAIELAELSRKTGLSLSIMQNRRYLRRVRAFRDLVQSGVIGPIGFVGADFFLAPRFGGFREQMASPLILDMAIHTFDQARFITGADPVSVTCHEWNLPGSWYKGHASAVCTFEMSDGSVFNYRGSWSAQGFPTSWEAAWRVAGSRGTGIWDGEDRIEAETFNDAGEAMRTEASMDWSGREGHAGCLDDIFAAIAEGRPAETCAADNVKSMAMVFGAMESSRRQATVRMAPLLQEYASYREL
ncbi:Gfo/Idh/MocA family protein [Paenibacillus thiaminolyticus]|uniref:Gfo/Idh/MocA family oxidoreductase n=1 Tax=Paenibacillus thiaminolyticus TaxID=49283 RepID=A0A3A3GAK4_PANTH|nr:Gfo/Idh/MocA family oxidoreductase [Paenibacillus thiaminolyticus]RJG15086.1 gfo/Idh/MocA family oxidoreductase [Paenibacillus thiaminolyticus]